MKIYIFLLVFMVIILALYRPNKKLHKKKTCENFNIFYL